MVYSSKARCERSRLAGLLPLQPLAHAAGVPTAYLELAQAIPEQYQIAAIRRAPQSLDKTDAHQRVAVNSEQLLRIGVFQFFQCVIRHSLTTGVVNGHVFLICLTIADLSYIY